MQAYLSLDGLRAALVLALAVAQALAAYWPELRRWPETIASRSAALRTPVVPVPWAFAIWGLIFASCLAFAVWHALPAQLGSDFARRLGWLSLALFAGNVLWEVYVPKRGLDWGSIAIIVAELAIALAIVAVVAGFPRPLSATEYWLGAAPLLLYAGWVTAATFVNLSSTLLRQGVRIDGSRSILLLAAAGALGGAVSWSTGAPVYALPVAWALFGIVVANLGSAERRPVVAICAGLLAIAVLAAAVLGPSGSLPA